ncbi:MAG TPA: hypothetical protein ENH32_06630 [Proteobacteria bacterium]|nr:fluoroacetyl-CoA thioesterase [bacterium BMS3Abin14]HDL53635.1 hypothetical protein [Pseudomonadota bacterium]
MGRLEPAMREGEISVGTMILVRHLKPTPPGLKVTAVVKLREVSGRKYLFDALVYDDIEKVGEGSIERAIIDKDRFERTLAEKMSPENQG